MSLEQRLADQLVDRHPERAAVALELAGREGAASILARAKAEDAAAVMRRMSPQLAAAILEVLTAPRAAEVLEALPLDAAVRLIRRLSPGRADEAFENMARRRAGAVRSLLQFPEGSAGALMDPEVLALPETLSAREAVTRVREAPEQARYNVYIVDGQQRLVGAVNLRELLLATPRTRLADLMVREPLHLDARADRAAVVAHRGWREVHSLPVVDEQGGYLGAVRYRTLRGLEDELFRRGPTDADVRDSLGQLFSAGAGAVLDALSATAPKRGV